MSDNKALADRLSEDMRTLAAIGIPIEPKCAARWADRLEALTREPSTPSAQAGEVAGGKQAAEWLLGMGWKWGDGHWIKPTTPQPQGDASGQAQPVERKEVNWPDWREPAPTADGGAICYRLHTGDPPRSWSWMDGKPTASVLSLAHTHGYPIEYGYPAPAPDVARQAIDDALRVLGPYVPNSVTDEGARWEWAQALRILAAAQKESTNGQE